MKNLSVLVCFILLFATKSLTAQETGIKFFQGSWQELLNESKKQKKPIFIDAYAVWCGPCKWMNANVFPNEEVGKFYNKNFINYKFDMEKGEGPEFARNYQIRAFPTLLWLNEKGEVKYRIMGGRHAEDFINEGQKALQEFVQ